MIYIDLLHSPGFARGEINCLELIFLHRIFPVTINVSYTVFVSGIHDMIHDVYIWYPRYTIFMSI